jgi:hypothetical protein
MSVTCGNAPDSRRSRDKTYKKRFETWLGGPPERSSKGNSRGPHPRLGQCAGMSPEDGLSYLEEREAGSSVRRDGRLCVLAR